MCVPDADNSMTTIEIQVFLSFLIPYLATFALHDVDIE
jgi:hypothetical protein